jgi:succinate-semialdehyde dehydrogenase/glutarate-semialdehyde dehydrogenase
MATEAIRAEIGRADAAFQDWRREKLADRAAALRHLETLLTANLEDLARLATAEMGKPLAQSRKEVEKCAACCRFYAANGEAMLADEPAPGGRSYVAFRPLGVVLSIMPWNFPYWQVARFAVPALLAGNGVVMKHADNTSGSGEALARLFETAFPPGLFRAIRADHEQIAEVIADPRLCAVTLTGSERAGRAVAARAGACLKKSVLELGGSDAYIVLADADVGAAAAICAEARLVNSGQSCVAAKRYIVRAEVHDEFVAALAASFAARPPGDPLDPATAVGPLARADLRTALAAQVDKSVERGATVRLGGKAVRGHGFFYEPTILTGVTPGMPAFDEETFGPVAAVVKAASDDEALRLANLSRFGLGGAFFARDAARAEALAREQLDAGFVAVNAMVASDPALPFGGVKASGYGRELGRFGIREFVNVKTVVH